MICDAIRWLKVGEIVVIYLAGVFMGFVIGFTGRKNYMEWGKDV